jgi:hypothetical protein
MVLLVAGAGAFLQVPLLKVTAVAGLDNPQEMLMEMLALLILGEAGAEAQIFQVLLVLLVVLGVQDMQKLFIGRKEKVNG